jgi:peptide/nickel transport system substrate-binding protein
MPAPSFRLQITAALAGLLIIGALLIRATALSPAPVAPAPGGTFVEGVVGMPRQINPLQMGSPVERDLADLLFAGLTRLDARGEIAPDLAASWRVSDDGKQYTFFLRQNARWPDHTPVTADDVLFTVGLLQHPAFPGDPTLVGLWQAVKVTKLDRLSIRFDLPQPYSPFLSFTTLGLLPAHLLRDVPTAELADAPFWAAPLGAGRWRIVAGRGSPGPTPGAAVAPTPDPQRGLLLEPNPEYHGTDAPPLLRRLWFRFYPTAGALLSAFDQGEIDGLGSVEPEAVAGLADRADVRLYQAVQPATQMILLNLRLPLFDRRETRQALLQGLDRAALVRQAAGGQGDVAQSPLLSSSWAYRPVLARYAYDPTAAASLLAGAGWADDGQGGRVRDDVPLRFTLVYPGDNPQVAALARAIQASWERIGVQAALRAVPRDQLLRDYLEPRTFEAVLIGWRGAANDPDVYQLWHSTQVAAPGFNFAGFRNDLADQALEGARQTLKRAERSRFYGAFQDVFATELPSLLLYYPRYTYAVSSRVHGVSLPPALADTGSRFQSLAGWYIETRAAITPK